MILERYWIFGAICLVYAAIVVYLLLRRRVTLQSSLLYLLLILAIGLAALLSPYSGWVAHKLGFTLPSNFFFALSIGALSLLHLFTLTTLSRLELRSITMVQELALMQERLTRALDEVRGGQPGPPAPTPVPPPARSEETPSAPPQKSSS